MTLNKIIEKNSFNKSNFALHQETKTDYIKLRDFEAEMKEIKKGLKDYREIKKTINDIEKSIEMYEKLKLNTQITKDILAPYKKILKI